MIRFTNELSLVQMITFTNQRSRLSVITERGDASTHSVLLIHDASDAASGTYSCAPSPSASASVKIHILIGALDIYLIKFYYFFLFSF